MLTSRQAWEVLQEFAPRGEWVGLDQLYELVAEHASLDDTDRAATSEKNASPRWKRTLRNVLQRRKSLGDIEWDGSGRFRLKPKSSD